MTSHTPQPQAGDDLVARLREGVAYLGSIEDDVETYDIDSANELMLKAAEALTSQQHTEPVAGEVVVYANKDDLSTMADFPGPITAWPKPTGYARSALVTKSSYDALAAAKDRLEKINADHCRTINTYVIDNARLADRAEAAERQRDALREILGDCQRALAMLVEPGQIVGTSLQAAWAICVAAEAKARAALKDEGSAT